MTMTPEQLVTDELSTRALIRRQLDIPGVRARMSMMGIPILITLVNLLDILDQQDGVGASSVRDGVLAQKATEEKRAVLEAELATARAKLDEINRAKEAEEAKRMRAEQEKQDRLDARERVRAQEAAARAKAEQTQAALEQAAREKIEALEAQADIEAEFVEED